MGDYAQWTAEELSKSYEYHLKVARKAHHDKMHLRAGKFSKEMAAAEELERMAVSRLGAFVLLYGDRITVTFSDDDTAPPHTAAGAAPDTAQGE